MADDLEGELEELDATTLAVRDLIGASRELVGRMAQVMGMNSTDMSAIGMLTQHGPMGAAELARRLGIRSASATVLVDRLERAGHVERVRDTVDRRRVVVTDTAAARAAALEAWLPSIREIDRICHTLSDAERAFALDFLHQVTAAIDRAGHGEALRDATPRLPGAPPRLPDEAGIEDGSRVMSENSDIGSTSMHQGEETTGDDDRDGGGVPGQGSQIPEESPSTESGVALSEQVAQREQGDE